MVLMCLNVSCKEGVRYMYCVGVYSPGYMRSEIHRMVTWEAFRCMRWRVLSLELGYSAGGVIWSLGVKTCGISLHG